MSKGLWQYRMIHPEGMMVRVEKGKCVGETIIGRSLL
jgi:hypothetical protein